MNCQQTRDLLPLYADGDLEGCQADAVARHLATCEECRRRLALDRELTARLSTLSKSSAAARPPADLRVRVTGQIERHDRLRPVRHIGRFAVSAAAMVAAVAIVAALVAGLLLSGLPIVEQRTARESPAPAGTPGSPTLDSSPIPGVVGTATPLPAPIEVVLTPGEATSTPVSPLSATPRPMVRIPARGLLPSSGTGPGTVAWSPGGNALAFAAADGVYVASGPEYAPARVSPILAHTLLWSPDGKSVAFGGKRDDNGASVGTLWLAAADGSTVRDLLPGDKAKLSVSTAKELVTWADDHTLVFREWMGTASTALATVDTASGEVRLIAGHDKAIYPNVYGTSYYLSPDQKLVAIESWGTGLPVVSILDTSSGKLTPIGGTESTTSSYQQFRGWSPDSSAFFYTQWAQAGDKSWPIQDQTPDLYRWDVVEGNGQMWVQHGYGASPSPDGRSVAFLLVGRPTEASGAVSPTEYQPGQPVEVNLGILDPIMSRMARLIPVAKDLRFDDSTAAIAWFDAHAPKWSPDGKSVAYLNQAGGVHLVEAGTDRLLSVFDAPGVQSIQWSPDGQHIALQATDEIWVMPVEITWVVSWPSQPSSSYSVPTEVSPTPSPIPTPAPAPPPSVRLTRIQMLNAKIGWATSEGSVLRTTDGGVSWLDVTPAQAAEPVAGQPALRIVTGAAFLDAQTAWVMFPSTDGTRVTVYGTRDGGHTWANATIQGMGGHISFVDGQHGWILAGQGAGAGSEGVIVYRTVDGGSNWEAMSRTLGEGDSTPNGLPLGGIKNGIAFRDAQVGWVSASVPVEGVIPLYITRDGGRTWAEQSLSLPKEFEKAWVWVDLPRFFGVSQGILPVRFNVEESSTLVFYSTSDGGETWEPGMPVKDATAYDFLDATTGWLVASFLDGGSLVTTRDGGKSWSQGAYATELSQTVLLDAVSDTEAFAMGSDSPDLLKTTDGGMTWTRLNSWLAGGLPGPTPAPSSAGAPACKGSDLSAKANLDGATGSLAGTLLVTNTGASACTIPAQPHIELRDGSDGWIQTKTIFTAPATGSVDEAVELTPGDQISISLVWRNWCGGEVKAPLSIKLSLPALDGSVAATVDMAPRDGGALTPRCDVSGETSILVEGPVGAVERAQGEVSR